MIMKSGKIARGPRYEALIQLLRTADTLWNSSRIFFSRWDLSPSQFNIMNLLHGSAKGYTQVELSRRLIMHRSNVTGLVDRLEKRKLARRTSKAKDRRAHVIQLTPAGRKLIREILPHYYQAAEEIWSAIPLRRVPPLISDLGKLQEQVERFAESKSVGVTTK